MECASSALDIQAGESPAPVKPQQAAGTQPWSQSREVRFKRRHRSARAAKGNHEAIQPRKKYRTEAEVISYTAGRKNQPKTRGWGDSVGVNRAWRAHKGNTCIPGRSANLRRTVVASQGLVN